MKTIKKTALIILCTGIFVIIGCNKDEKKIEPTPPPSGGTPTACNCGVVVSKNPALVNVTLQNTCSNTTQAFTVAYSVMNNANNGDTICMATGTSW